MNAHAARRALLVIGLAALTGFAASPAAAADKVPLSELAKPGRILMLRHANAPGVGDPPGFKLRDCPTQRNLDASGRDQARELGARLRAAGVKPATVYSSQWCRCLETARLLQLGPVTEEPPLNSFFGRSDAREPQLDRLRARLAALPIDGAPIVMVTHQVVVSAFSGSGVASGSGAIFELNGSAAPRLVGEI